MKKRDLYSQHMDLSKRVWLIEQKITALMDKVLPSPDATPTPAQYPWADGVDLTGGLVGWAGVICVAKMRSGRGGYYCDPVSGGHGGTANLSELTPVHPTTADVGRRVRVVSTTASTAGHPVSHCVPPDIRKRVGATGIVRELADSWMLLDFSDGEPQWWYSPADLMLLADAPAEQPVSATDEHTGLTVRGTRNEHTGVVTLTDVDEPDAPAIVAVPAASADMRAAVEAAINARYADPALQERALRAALDAQAKSSCYLNGKFRNGHERGVEEQRAATLAAVATALKLEVQHA